jgi:hypothetical protein
MSTYKEDDGDEHACTIFSNWGRKLSLSGKTTHFGEVTDQYNE